MRQTLDGQTLILNVGKGQLCGQTGSGVDMKRRVNQACQDLGVFDHPGGVFADAVGFADAARLVLGQLATGACRCRHLLEGIATAHEGCVAPAVATITSARYGDSEALTGTESSPCSSWGVSAM